MLPKPLTSSMQYESVFILAVDWDSGFRVQGYFTLNSKIMYHLVATNLDPLQTAVRKGALE